MMRGTARRAGPGVEVIDMIADVAAVAAKARPGALAAHRLHLAWAQAQIESRLLGRQERASLLRPRCAGDVIVHGILAARLRHPRPPAQRTLPIPIVRAEARKQAIRNSIRPFRPDSRSQPRRLASIQSPGGKIRKGAAGEGRAGSWSSRGRTRRAAPTPRRPARLHCCPPKSYIASRQE